MNILLTLQAVLKYLYNHLINLVWVKKIRFADGTEMTSVPKGHNLYDIVLLSQAIAHKGFAFLCKNNPTTLNIDKIPTLYNDILSKYNQAENTIDTAVEVINVNNSFVIDWHQMEHSFYHNGYFWSNMPDNAYSGNLSFYRATKKDFSDRIKIIDGLYPKPFINSKYIYYVHNYSVDIWDYDGTFIKTIDISVTGISSLSAWACIINDKLHYFLHQYESYYSSNIIVAEVIINDLDIETINTNIQETAYNYLRDNYNVNNNLISVKAVINGKKIFRLSGNSNYDNFCDENGVPFLHTKQVQVGVDSLNNPIYGTTYEFSTFTNGSAGSSIANAFKVSETSQYIYTCDTTYIYRYSLQSKMLYVYNTGTGLWEQRVVTAYFKDENYQITNNGLFDYYDTTKEIIEKTGIYDINGTLKRSFGANTISGDGVYYYNGIYNDIILSYYNSIYIYDDNVVHKTVFTDNYVIDGSVVSINYYKYIDTDNVAWKICVPNSSNDTNLEKVYKYLGYHNYFVLDLVNLNVSLPRNSNLYTAMYVGDNYEDTLEDFSSKLYQNVNVTSEIIINNNASITLNIQPNKNYQLTNSDITDITIDSCESSNLETVIEFSTGANAPTLTDNSNLSWNGSVPTLNANKTYTIVIFNNKAFYEER